MQSNKLWLTLLFSTAFFATAAQGLLGKNAPVPNLRAVLQAKGKDPLSSLDGKVVVLEFWGTYCTPCLQNLGHLNALAEHFADSNVQFISITHEDETRIRSFLQRRKMSGWVGIDSNHMTAKAYGVDAYPRTFIIDAHGVVRYDGGPWELNEQVIRAVASGDYLPVADIPQRDKIILGGYGPGQDPVFTAHFNPDMVRYQLIIRRSVGMGGMGYKSGNGSVGIDLLNKNIRFIISFLDSKPSDLRVVNNTSVADTAKWDIIFSSCKNDDLVAAQREVRAKVEEAFGLSIHDSVVTSNVLVPDYQKAEKIREEKNIDFNDPASHTLKSLEEIFTLIEERGGVIVDFPLVTSVKYIDVFAIISDYYKMSAADLQHWLQGEGISFKKEQRQVKVEVLQDSGK